MARLVLFTFRDWPDETLRASMRWTDVDYVDTLPPGLVQCKFTVADDTVDSRRVLREWAAEIGAKPVVL